MFFTKELGASNNNFIKHENKDLAIIFNGEIYNFQEIKQQLSEK
jgi:asparagine synthetase B (glutamine-hydrolysing)